MNLSLYIEETIKNLSIILNKLGFHENKQTEILNYFKKNIENNLVIFIGGSQIRGSVSPFMHNFTAFTNSYPLTYMLFSMDIENLKVSEIMKFIEREKNVVGANVSMPYKLEVYDYMIEKCVLDKSAYLVGAVNTIVKENGNLVGYNTDIEGIINPIKEKLINKEISDRGYVMGAGGASRAVITAMIILGIKKIGVFNRSEDNLKSLKNHFENKKIREIFSDIGVGDYEINTEVYDLEKCNLKVEKDSILVNTLPFGFKENLPKYPIKKEELDRVLKNIKLYFDIVYDLNYSYTPLEQYIKDNHKNIIVCNGIDMVIGQAKKGYEMWSKGNKFDTDLIKNKLNIIS